VRADVIVLAASTVESARLFINSALRQAPLASGRYLAEHLERRAKIRVVAPASEVESQGISLIIPPYGKESADRFQIHLRGEPDPADGKHLIIDIGGFAAMDPSDKNAVKISPLQDEFGVPKAETIVSRSEDDSRRVDNMCCRMIEIGRTLDGQFITHQFPYEGIEPQFSNDQAIQIMAPGRSYHEAGTLRMGDPNHGVTDEFGKIYGIDNLYVSDASLFPCVGIANPMLTITALAYRVADEVHRSLTRGITNAAAGS
jgi:choline dehydrogenase-like flavoprotein